MGDSANKPITILQRPKCSYARLSKNKEASMNLEDAIATCLRIINNILFYTNTLEAHNSSFDYSLRQDTETDSDSDKETEDWLDIEHYLITSINYLGIDKHLLILSMMTFDKLLQKNPDFIFSDRNSHKVLFLCLMETQKFYDDNTYTNKDYAKVGNIGVNELLLLEIEFLNMIQFDLNNSNEAFTNYTQKLTKYWEGI